MENCFVNTAGYGTIAVMKKRQEGTGPARLGEPTVTVADWTDAALQLIAEAGVAGLTVSALATRLSVTKGSFYWHFNSRDELLAAALKQWEERATGDAMKGLSAVPDVRRRLELMLEAASQPPRSHSLYAALAEASSNRVVRQVLSRVASARTGYLASCYRELGFAHPEADAMALLAYAAYRGLLQLAREAPATLPKDWSFYPAAVLQALVPADRPAPAITKLPRRKQVPVSTS